MTRSNPAPGYAELFDAEESARKGQILTAAAEVFAERGYQRGSMRDIAERVGVSEPALYRHFPGKDALFLALIRIAAGKLRADAFEIIDAVRPGSVRAHLLAAFADRRQVIARYAPVLRSVLAAVAFNQEFRNEFREVMIEPVRGRLLEAAAELDEAFDTLDAERTREARVRALMSLFVGFSVTSFVLADEPDEAIADAALRVMGWPG